MRKFAWILVFGAALSGVVIGGCGPSEEPVKPIENPQKGEGDSADGDANQSGASNTVDETE